MEKKDQALLNFHQSLLEALRHREQEIFRYLAILFPALGGYVWLLYQNTSTDFNRYAFIIGTVGVILLLFFGAAYSLALGYSFRQLTLQLANLERDLQFMESILKGWPRKPIDFDKYSVNFLWVKGIPWCVPPEVIKIFWYAFLVEIIFVTSSAWRFVYVKHFSCLAHIIVISSGLLAFFIAAILLPIHYGYKLSDRVNDEKSGKK